MAVAIANLVKEWNDKEAWLRGEVALRNQTMCEYEAVCANAVRDGLQRPPPSNFGDVGRPMVRSLPKTHSLYNKYCGVGTGAASVSDVGVTESSSWEIL